MVSTLSVGGLCAVNWLVFGIRRMMLETDEKKLEAFSFHGSIFLGLTYVFYPTLSLMQFKAYLCVQIDDDLLLSADLSIDCDSERYQSFIIFNVLLTVIT